MKQLTDASWSKITYIYLGLPFLVFAATWFNFLAAAIFSIIIIVSLFYCFKNISENHEVDILKQKSKNTLWWTLLILIVIVFFSGIGSYTFQNLDHLYRNAIFRDLVTKPWPAIYEVKGFDNHFLEGKTAMMTYYMGYFLPSALLGKIFGFKAAQFFLYVWSVLGMYLVYYQTCKYFKKFNLKVLWLILGWGTLFYLGAIYKFGFDDIAREKNYLWAGMILYADSNLGMLYWTFNQSIMAWLVVLFMLQNISPKNILFLVSNCFFLSPFAFAGLIPFVIYFIIKNYTKAIGNLWNNAKIYFSFQNVIGGGSIIALNLLYLSSNQASKFFQMLHHKPKIFLVFILLSWGIIAAMIFKNYIKNGLFWLVIAVLLPLPFFQQGYGIDFPGRLSIPAMFILMLLVGKVMIESKSVIQKRLIMAYLVVSALGHGILETGRSMYFTGIEYWGNNSEMGDSMAQSENNLIKHIGTEMQANKGKALNIKDLGTLTNPKNEVLWNYVADVENSKFYEWIAKKP